MTSDVDDGHDDPHGGFEPLFRALTVGRRRRGVRLEREFWDILEFMMQERNQSFAQLVEPLEEAFPDSRNLTSLLRVACASWLKSELNSLRQRTSVQEITKVVDACPAPAFILSSTRRLHFYNTAFLRFVRSQFSALEPTVINKGLRLQIDIATGDLIEKLRKSEERFITLGFVIGLESRRVRGQMNAVLAPTGEDNMIIGYVIA
jgi:predicted DNA-binding ribbon-helix-helix protein